MSEHQAADTGFLDRLGWDRAVGDFELDLGFAEGRLLGVGFDLRG